MDNLDELEVMFQHINVTGLSSVIPRVQKTTTPIDVGDDSNDNEDNGHIGQDAKRKENIKLLLLIILLALRRRVGILWLSKCHDLSMCWLLVRAKMTKRLKMTS